MNNALREEVAADGPVHALSIVATTPERWREKMERCEDAVGPSLRSSVRDFKYYMHSNIIVFYFYRQSR